MAAQAPVNVGQLITCTPGVQGGQPCIAGTRMRVCTIAIYHNEGMNAEEILEEVFPHLDLIQIYAALAYYYANKAEIDAGIEAANRLYDKLAARYPNGSKGVVDLS